MAHIINALLSVIILNPEVEKSEGDSEELTIDKTIMGKFLPVPLKRKIADEADILGTVVGVVKVTELKNAVLLIIWACIYCNPKSGKLYGHVRVPFIHAKRAKDLAINRLYH